MAAGDFSRDLGEFGGRLDSLVPALERMEERQNKMSTELTQTTTNLTNLMGQVKDLGKTVGDEKFRNQDQDNALMALKDQKLGWAQKTWDLAKLLLAAILGGLVTWGLKRLVGGP